MNPTHPNNNTPDGPVELTVVTDETDAFWTAERRSRRVELACWTLRIAAMVVATLGIAGTVPAPSGNPLTFLWSALPDLLVAPVVAWRHVLVAVALAATADALDALGRRWWVLPALPGEIDWPSRPRVTVATDAVWSLAGTVAVTLAGGATVVAALAVAAGDLNLSNLGLDTQAKIVGGVTAGFLAGVCALVVAVELANRAAATCPNATETATRLFNALAGAACGAVATWFGVRMILDDPHWWGWVITNVPGIAITATGLAALQLAARQLHALTRPAPPEVARFSVQVSASVPEGGTFKVDNPFTRPAASDEMGEGR